jgi:type IV secretion system protein VirB8
MSAVADGHPDLTAYYQEAASWDIDRIAGWQRSARRGWQAAAAAALCAVLACAALLVMLPLKQVEPYLIRVDNSTGIVDVVPVYGGRAQLTETVTRYLLTHYVLVCERFNYATAESDYEECGAFHTAQRNQAWYALWNTNNPASPLNVHKDGSTVSVQIESLSFFRRASGVTDLAQVRYLKIEHQPGGAQQRTTHWIATMEYAYTAPASAPRVRQWNPLGFKVVNFVSEPEVVQEEQDPSSRGASRTQP